MGICSVVVGCALGKGKKGPHRQNQGPKTAEAPDQEGRSQGGAPDHGRFRMNLLPSSWRKR